MAPPSWANEEQLKFLRSRQNDHWEKRVQKKLALFWPVLDREWFERWPIALPDTPIPQSPEEFEASRKAEGELIARQKKRLKDWFNNNNISKTKLRNGHLSYKPFQIQMKPRRRPQHIEIYSRQYYKDRVRDRVKAEIENKGLSRKEILGTIKRLTAEAFEAEDPELKEGIFAQAAAMKNAPADNEEAADGNPTPESYADAIQVLPAVLDKFFEELSLRTGWVFTVLAGGPEPANGGKIRTLGYDCGKNNLGLAFGAAHPSFQTTFLKPFAAFVKQVFPTSIRESRAIILKTDDPDEPPTTAADMAALSDTVGPGAACEPSSTPEHVPSHPISVPATVASQPDVGLDVGLAIDTLLAGVHSPADGTSSVRSRAGSHPSISVAPAVTDGLGAGDALITYPFLPPPSSILVQTNEPTSELSPASLLGLCSPPPLSNPLPAAAPSEHPNEPGQPNKRATAEPCLPMTCPSPPPVMTSVCPTSDITLTFPQAVTAAPAATSPINKRVAVSSPPPPPTATPSACCSPHSNSAPQSIITAPPTASSGPANKPSHSSPPTAMQSAHHSSDPVQTPPAIAAVPPTSTDNTQICMPIAPSTTITPHGQSGSVPPVIVEKKRKRVMAETHDDQGGRGQRQRKAPATKEVIPLTDAKRLDPHVARVGKRGGR